MLGFNIEHFKILFNENWKIATNLLDTNEQVVQNYFKTVDVELYYGDGKVAKPLTYLRNLY